VRSKFGSKNIKKLVVEEMEIIENEENPYSRNMKKNTEENPNPFGSHIIIGALAAFVYIYKNYFSC
jgi:hypothetical protein